MNDNLMDGVQHGVVPPTIDNGRAARSVAGNATHSSAGFDTVVRVPADDAASRQVRSARRGTPRARRMSLSLIHLDVWSVSKVTFLLAVAGGIIQVVAAALVWTLLNVAGVFDRITQIFSSTGLDTGGLDLTNILSLGTVVSAVTIFSIVEAVLVTLLVAIVTLLYNVVSNLVGGIHMTLGDD